MQKKQISILGSTGSIGTQTLDVIRNHLDYFEVYALAVNSNIKLLKDQIKEFKPKKVVVFDSKNNLEMSSFVSSRLDLEILSGIEGLIEISEDKNVDIVVASMVGAIGLEPIKSALRKGKIIAYANKETMAVAGKKMKELEKKYGGEIRPIDSELSAIWQCMRSGEKKEIKKIWLTASGGPFRDINIWPQSKIEKAKTIDALKHPTWNMGAKITIDSATLANKGLEFIETMYLFDLKPDQIEVVIHPQSLIHSAIEFIDGSIIAEIGATDMRRAIAYSLFGQKRIQNNFKHFSFFDKSLTFERPDFDRFPCLGLAIKSAKHSQEACKIFNNTNEKAVELYLKGEIGFYDISKMIEEDLNKYFNLH